MKNKNKNNSLLRSRYRHFAAGLTGTALLTAMITTAWASGWTPFAIKDEISMPRGASATRLITGATSVLANDFDIERDTLTAILRSDVKHGELTLNADGTFLYVHDGGNDKDDKFKYRAFDGTNESRDAEVEIKFTKAEDPPEEPDPPEDPDPPAPSEAPVILSQNELITGEDQSLEITLADLNVLDSDSNYPRDFTLSVRNGNNFTHAGTVITPIRDFNGTLSVPVLVNDGQADSPIFVLQVTVTPGNDSPFVSSPVEDQNGTEGDFFELALAGNFGEIDAGDVLSYAAAGLPPSGSLAIDPNTGLLSGTPQLTDALDVPYQVIVTAQDGSGASVALAFRLTIGRMNHPDLKVTVKVEPGLVTFRDSPDWEIEIENLGPGPLQEGLLQADWFSSAAPVSLSSSQNCDISENDTIEPTVRCILPNLPADSATTVTVQSTHLAPGDSTIRAVVTASDPVLGNNSAGLSLSLAASFSEGPVQFLQAAGADIAGADLNMDGHPDLIVAADQTLIFFNNGERRMTTPAVSLGTNSGGVSIALPDWNMDGALDIAIASGTTDPDKLYINDGQGGFSAAIDLPTSSTTSILAADINGDGLAEIVVTGIQGTRIVRNDGQGTPISAQLHPVAGRHLASGDLTGSGFTDLVLTDAITRDVHLLINKGVGLSFTEIAFGLGSVASVSLRDLNNDGAPDLILAIDGADFAVPQNRILINQRTGEFFDWASVGAAPTSEILAGDVNRDGFPDLVVINETGIHQLFRGNGSGSFELEDEHILSLGIQHGRLLDINGDGSLDLILAGSDSNRVDIHVNNGLGKFGHGDQIPPVISVNGAVTMELTTGDSFEDPGATAQDEIDGDLTQLIQSSSTVSSSVVGSYAVTYSVADRSGNVVQATRFVNVVPRAEGGGGGGTSGAVIILLLTVLTATRRRWSGQPA